MLNGLHLVYKDCSPDSDLQKFLFFCANQVTDGNRAEDKDVAESVSCFIMHHYFQTRSLQSIFEFIFQLPIPGAGPQLTPAQPNMHIYTINCDNCPIASLPSIPACFEPQIGCYPCRMNGGGILMCVPLFRKLSQRVYCALWEETWRFQYLQHQALHQLRPYHPHLPLGFWQRM